MATPQMDDEEKLLYPTNDAQIIPKFSRWLNCKRTDHTLLEQWINIERYAHFSADHATGRIHTHVEILTPSRSRDMAPSYMEEGILKI